jgi:hypothetical protein
MVTATDPAGQDKHPPLFSILISVFKFSSKTLVLVRSLLSLIVG